MPQLTSENKAAGFLLSALTVLTGTLFVSLGITGDALASMFRNHPVFGAGAFIATIGGVICGAWAFTHADVPGQRKFLRRGLGLVFLGFSFAVVGATLTYGQREQPSVAAAISRTADGLVLGMTVQATDLKSKDHVIVSAEPLTRKTTGGHRTYTPGDPLFGASIGPSKSGDIDRPITVPLPPKEYTDVQVKAWVGTEPEDCFGSGNSTGCVSLQVPRIPEAPQLNASWTGRGKTMAVVIDVRAHDIAGRRMSLSAVGVQGKTRRVLAAWRLSPNGQGVFERQLRVPVGPKVKGVCVVASMTKLKISCTRRPNPVTSWVFLLVKNAS